MSYFLPSSIQKRLLRYALSRVDFLDTETLDLDRLDIAWGKRSVVELRDVGFRLKALSALLNLPPNFELAHARLPLLRVAIPADIYSKPIAVDIEGTRIQIKVQTDADIPTKDAVKPESGSKSSRSGRGESARGDRHLSSPPGSPDGPRSGRHLEDEEHGHLPTTKDLAQSFLETEPLEEKAELEAAIASQSNYLQGSTVSSDDGELEIDSGTGTALTLPGFLAGFLKGVADRLEVRVKDVEFNLDIDLYTDGQQGNASSPSKESVTVQLKVEDVDVEGVTTTAATTRTTPQDAVPGKRTISLHNIRGALISDASFFASHTRSAGPPSPSVTFPSAMSERGGMKSPQQQPRSMSRGSSSSSLRTSRSASHASVTDEPGAVEDMLNSTIFESIAGPPPAPHRMETSVATSDGGRFADASDDDDDEEEDDRSPKVERSQDDVTVTEKSAHEDAQEPESPTGMRGESADLQHSEPDLSTNSLEDSLPHVDTLLTGSLHSVIHEKTAEGTQETDEKSLHTSQSESEPTIQESQSDIRTTENDLVASNIVSQEEANDLNDEMSNEPIEPPSPAESSGNETSSTQSGTPCGDDLAQSRVFSHEEAESMYMSAVSRDSPSQSRRIVMPGGWDASRYDDLGQSGQYPSHAAEESARPVTPRPGSVYMQTQGVSADREKPSTEGLNTSPLQSTGLGHATAPERPHPLQSTSSEKQSYSSGNTSRVTKEILKIDRVSIRLPGLESTSSGPTPDVTAQPFDGNSRPSQVAPAGDPHSRSYGRFSAYAQRKNSGEASKLFERHNPDHSSFLPDFASSLHESSIYSPMETSTHEENLDCIDLLIRSIDLAVDMSVCRLVIKLLQQLRPESKDEPPKPKEPEAKERKSEQKELKTFLRVDRISLKLLDRLYSVLQSPAEQTDNSAGGILDPQPLSEVLISTSVTGFEIKNISGLDSSSARASIEKFFLGDGSDVILSFDASRRLRASVRDLSSAANKDVSFSITRTGIKRKIEVTTLPLHVSLNLERLDDTITWLGGFSSILDLGSSIASNTTIVGAKNTGSKPAKRSRGVHFETPMPPSEDSSAASTKANVRIGGIFVHVIGRVCSVKLQTSAMKLVSRQEGLGLQVDKVELSGPYLRLEKRAASATAELGNIRVEYLSNPEEKDLARLLSLLNPSNNKYEQDDDILLDTLLRQRKQGAVLRITVANVSGGIANLNDLEYFASLGKEFSRLSTVAKYLPEDDRPGILILGLIRELEYRVQINEQIGEINLALQNLEVAQVTLPSLLALGVQNLSLYRNSEEELVGEAINSQTLSPHAQVPMIMVRMIGDEMEPTIRIKLWNFRAEYRVSTLMAAMGISAEQLVEDVVNDMVASVITLTARQPPTSPLARLSRETSSSSESAFSSRTLKADIVLRDSMVGLNPRDMPSKALVVLIDTRFAGAIPRDSDFSATLEVKKAYLMAIDDTNNLLDSSEIAASMASRYTSTKSDISSTLSDMGYVSLSYISSAKVTAKVIKAPNSNEKCIDLEVKDDLFVLESCADSTQTLLSIINGLKPPMPPSKDIKYRTEVIPVQDMLASLSGDAFVPSGPGEEVAEEYPLGLEEGDMMDDEVPRNLEYVSSFYRPQPGATSEEMADSMLDDDLGHLASQPITREIGDKVLLESFQEQYEVAPGNEPLNFQEDHFGSGVGVEGTAHKWDSALNAYGVADRTNVQTSPLRVRVRDIHVIWNLFDGYDWQKTRDTISKAVRDVEIRATERRNRSDRRSSFEADQGEEESVIGDFLFNSIYIGISANRDPRELARQINRNVDDLASETESYAPSVPQSPSRQSQPGHHRGRRLRLQRSKKHKIAFELKGLSADLVVFPQGSGETQSSIDVRVRDLEIFDNVPTSTWKKFATYMHDAGERETGKSMVHLEILNVRPVPELAASEIVIKVTVLPLRLHVDQDALDFITRFFEFKDDSAQAQTSPADVPFLQRVEVNSVQVRLDYKPKNVDYAGIRSGHTTEFMNFFILDQADIVLRHVIIYGISGFDKLSKTLNDIWMPDVKRNQLPGVLAGLAPVRSLVNVGGGVKDLVVVPIREYKKDGRIVRSIQKGALAFAKTTTSELVKLGAKLAIGTQTVLQGAEDFLSQPGVGGSGTAHGHGHDVGAGWEDDEADEEEKKVISLYADQPVGVVQGLRGAYSSLGRDLIMARDAIVAVPGEVLDSGSAQGAAKAVWKRTPTVIFRPAIGATRAISQTLMGATNSLDPENRRRLEDKYKRH
ncbi:hypothetical protein L228DRAFT_218714 [Xylona heveae TC161]|uniref:Autophagy-related protein 2 n=1 Tax=Xylona heveae (strain CBS 132557 / TC161) TaxID=1328760 RepID=A0A165I3J1_XYLHT|nr:hypothetical protein L228DRAFT_218714 [Xylona heveae TC161]KZF24325.1 hypothetical protein L228DRAFT_218714 [Xylona heveae TC161]